MYSIQWQLSPRAHGVKELRHVKVRMSDGICLDGDIFLPDGEGHFPVILGVHAYDNAMQSVPSKPQAMQGRNAQAEAGDPQFYARRGYVHAIFNARGTGESEGAYSHYGPRDVEDICELIAWLADQSWSTGKVGMFGVSYFSVAAKQVAARNPPALKAVWGQFGYTDFYRDKFYHGGILAHTFLTSWSRHLAGARVEPWSKKNLGEKEYQRRLTELARDRDIMAVPELALAVRQPDHGAHPIILDVLMNPTDGPYWHERNPTLEDIRVPIMLGACWGMYGLHLPGEFRAWQRISAPKKMIVGPRIYLDRPVYQYAYESLRWFDHWLKDNDTGYLDEAPIQLFIHGEDGRWHEGHDWPLPETCWHPFYLHRDGLLSEHEFWPNEGSTSFEDNVFNGRGSATFITPPLVERTVLAGPAKLSLYVSTTAEDVHLFASLWDIDPEGGRRLLTRGWLKGSMAATDPEASKPWLAHHPLNARVPLEPNEARLMEVNIVPTANVFLPGHRIAVRISSTDEDPPASFLDLVAQGHLLRQKPSWITVYHDADHPSRIDLPVISGNRIGTYMSGGENAPRANASGTGEKRGWDQW